MLLDRLKADRRAVELLGYHYDFDVDAGVTEVWFSVAQAERVLPVAADAAGGIFATCYFPGGNSAVVYASSEGQGGVLANDLGEWLALLLALPYWFDLLKFSGGGELAEMRQVEPFAAKELIADDPDLPDARDYLLHHFSVRLPSDPVAALHGHVTSGATRAQLWAPDGSALESLFNTFRRTDNRTWRSDVGPTIERSGR